ncbi:MAG: PH domain-containing protein [Ilumatobacteraceae bacterium]
MNTARVRSRRGRVSVTADWRERVAFVGFAVLVALIPVMVQPKDERPVVCTGTTIPPVEELVPGSFYTASRDCQPDPSLPPPKRRDFGWTDAAVIAAAALFGTRRALGVLRFDEDGVLVRNMFLSRRLPWSDIGEIMVADVAYRGRVHGVGVRRRNSRGPLLASGAGALVPLKAADYAALRELLEPWAAAHDTTLSLDSDD